MRFAIYSEVGEQSIREKLGRPDYSYYFVLKSFLPALQRIGTIDYVRDPATDLDAIFASCAARGEPCLFVSFSPPHKAFISHDHPMIVVFAWEFSTIPDEIWSDDPRNDWRTVFAHNGRAATLSGHTARIVKAAMGPDFPILAIPGVVWDRFESVRVNESRSSVIEPTELCLEGLILDSRTLDLSPDYLLRPEPPIPEPPVPEHQKAEPSQAAEIFVEAEPVLELQDPEPVAAEPEPTAEAEVAELPLTIEEPRAVATVEPAPAPPRKTLRYRFGVTRRHALEWYREAIRDLLPRWLVGLVSRIGRASYGIARLFLRPAPTAVPEPIATEALPSNVAEIEPPPADGPAMESIAAADLSLDAESGSTESAIETEIADAAQIVESAPSPPPRWPEARVTVDGVVYTSVLNPTDGRKNWWDLIIGFCWAFRDREDATLVLKMVNGDLGRWYRSYIQMLSQLSPFRCRVIALHGYLEEAEYEKLIAATSYYVNVSGCEGLCLPLMEFMSCGKPAIAPRHTAMEDYIDEENAFTLDFWVEHNVWPHDPRNLFRTERLRLDWASVRDAYLKSYRVAKDDPALYRAMGDSACRTMRDYCSEEVVTTRLRTFLDSTDGEIEPYRPPVNDVVDRADAEKVAAL